jgi:PPOX class probable F420-dependent enzyme
MRLVPAQARLRFAGARVARLATVGDDGRPHVVPIVFAVSGDVVYTAVDAKPKRTTELRRLRNIAVNPQVSVLADAYDEDWTRLWWVRADGMARRMAAAERAEAIDLLVAKYPQYAAAPPGGPVLRIDVERWTGWSAQTGTGAPSSS